MELSTVINYLNDLLQPQLFRDYCPNGLQVQGNSTIKTLVTGVSASQALIEAAIELQADALLVHHGFFWKNESPSIVGMKYRRIKALLLNEINLLAYHLPLDAHPLYGNNIQLGQLLGLENIETFEVEPGLNLGYKGRLPRALSGELFSELIARKLLRTPLHIESNDRSIETVAWCTGGAQDYLSQAIDQNIDAYLTGEVSERTFHLAKENNIHFYAAGHHATERYGVKALGEHLSQKFNLIHHFVDIDNPV
ncbi:MAG: Nif3-like dinuclear metal center hexameric protein [Gammaproteobacteria bacterium]|nr:Nif3-like dinuclear metal center hexameric protein [Gammaproteobacteria bacterium]